MAFIRIHVTGPRFRDFKLLDEEAEEYRSVADREDFNYHCEWFINRTIDDVDFVAEFVEYEES